MLSSKLGTLNSEISDFLLFIKEKQYCISNFVFYMLSVIFAKDEISIYYHG